jgi:hypothetical protein
MNNAQWQVMIPGASSDAVDTAALSQWAQSGVLKANSLVKEVSTGVTYSASQIPGVFSDKSYLTALLLSIFVGPLGIDRFYVGHVGLGVGKLLTLGGLGVWSLIDLILFATRSVKDADGRPLA